MRVSGLIAATSILVSACGTGDRGPTAAAEAGNEAEAPAAGNQIAATPAATPEKSAAMRWDLQSSGEGAALALLPGSGPAAIRLFCPAGRNRLLVNVPGFRPIGSEERLSFGGGGDAVALVADPRGDSQRGGVSGAGEVPDGLKALVAGPLSASYGAQRSGPHPAPPRSLASAFVAACREGATAARQAAEGPAGSASPCLVQDGERLRISPLRAVGTEPFWGARIEGRCVTYSHPEDQKGTRIWTRHTSGPDGGIWTGSLGGKPFRLATRARKDCSDGMSDRRYPFEVDLLVGGERRSGCAEPL
ncbi:MAG TPA: hypothetical protein VD846_12725 [Allosphingosinicella sp.]|nr:hypothetical protein [Allosphingosinicella sp.]